MAGGKSNYTQETIVLNSEDAYKGVTISRRTRINKTTGRRGKGRVSFDVKTEPIVHTFDDEALGRGPAEALKNIIARQIREIGKDVANSTTLSRDWAARRLGGVEIESKTLKSGKEKRSYAKKGTPRSLLYRYDGGQIGPTPPKGSDKLFNDSGRLADHLRVGKNRQAAGQRDWVVNTPANRFRGHTEPLAKELVKHVKALGRPATLKYEKELREAVNESISLLIIEAKNAADARRKALLQKRRNYQRRVFSELLGLAKTIARF